MQGINYMVTYTHHLIISHESGPLRWVFRCSISADVEESERLCGSPFIHGLEPRKSAVLTHTFDLLKVKLASPKWRHSHSPERWSIQSDIHYYFSPVFLFRSIRSKVAMTGQEGLG